MAQRSTLTLIPTTFRRCGFTVTRSNKWVMWVSFFPTQFTTGLWTRVQFITLSDHDDDNDDLVITVEASQTNACMYVRQQ
jgi:hypothetical protein